MSGDLNVAEVAERLLGMELQLAPKEKAAEAATVAAAQVAAGGEEPVEKTAAALTDEQKENDADVDADAEEDKDTAVKVMAEVKGAEVATEPAEASKKDNEEDNEKEAEEAEVDEDDDEDDDDDDDEEQSAIGCEPDDLDELIDQVATGSRRVSFFAIQGLRRRLSDRYEAPAYSRLLTSPALAALVANADNDADSELQFESLWALTNLLAGSGARPTDLVATSGLGRPLIRLLKSGPTERLREQACWALANIAGESAAWRDQLLSDSGDLLAALEALWDSNPNNGLVDASSLLLVNVFRDRNPRVRFEVAQRLVPRLARLLRHPYEAAVPHVIWAASYAVEDCEPRARLLLREPGTVDCLAGFLASEDADDALLVPTLRLFCGLSACVKPLPVAELEAAGLFASICGFISHEQVKLRRQALVFFGNVSSGPDAHLEAMMRAGCLPAIGAVLTGEPPLAGPWERTEAFWILPNFLMSRSHRFSQQLIKECLDGLLDALTLEDSNITRCGLLCLRHLLLSARYKRRCDLDFAALKRQIEAHDGVKKIELAQKTDDKELVNLSYQLVEQFFWGNESKYSTTAMTQEEGEQKEGKGGSGECQCSQEAGATGGGGGSGASGGASPIAASASPEIGDDDRGELRDSEAEQPQPEKDALSSLIGGLQATD